MLRPTALSMLTQDLLTRSADFGLAKGQGLQDQMPGTDFDLDHSAGIGLSPNRVFQDSATRFLPTAPLPHGRNFTSPDALGLSAPLQPANAHGQGLVGRVEARLAHLLHLPFAACLPSRDTAIRTALGAILQPGDTVLLDQTLFSAMSETVLTLGAHPLRFPEGSVSGVERRLRRLSAMPGAGRLWVALSALSAHSSTVAGVADLADLCHQYNAGLIVDVSQDLGLVGPNGAGVMEEQGCLGRADLIFGSFARAFGSPGGFVACHSATLAKRLRQNRTHQSASSQMAKILATFDLIEGSEGQRRRFRLHALGLRLRNHLLAEGIPVLGQASPMVPVKLVPQTAQACTNLMHSAGISVRLLREPMVARHAPRWCLRLTAEHSPADIDTLADLIRDVTRSMARR